MWAVTYDGNGEYVQENEIPRPWVFDSEAEAGELARDIRIFFKLACTVVPYTCK